MIFHQALDTRPEDGLRDRRLHLPSLPYGEHSSYAARSFRHRQRQRLLPRKDLFEAISRVVHQGFGHRPVPLHSQVGKS